MLSTVVYTPASPLRNLPQLFAHMGRDVWVSRELAWRLFVRDTSAQYRQSALGYLWVVIPPLAAALPFVLLEASGIMALSETPVPYAAYAMIGTTIWQVFVDALNAPLRTISAAKPMLARVNLPREAILLSALIQVAFGFLIRLVLLIGVLAWFGIAPAETSALFPLGIASLILFGFVLGLLLTPLGVLYSDVQQSLPIATTFLMLMTPVIYTVPQSGFAAVFASLNPLTPLVAATRDWLILGHSPHAAALVLITSVTFVLAFCGWVTFRVAMPHLIARIGT